MKRKNRALARWLRGNKGSGIITVLVSVAFVSILATVLLYMSYVGFKMKVTERRGKENFYDAETALNEIRMGIQLAVSDSIAYANTRVLEKYNESVENASNNDDAFKAAFETAILDWQPPDVPDDYLLYESQIVNLDGGALYSGACYNSDMLLNFISDAQLPYVTVTTELPETSQRGVLTGLGTEIYTFKDLTISYVKDGYETNITTDISVKVPDFTYALSDLVLTAIQDYVIIADDALIQNFGMTVKLDGNVYAGEVNLSGGGNSLIFGANPDYPNASYLFITPGAINVNTSAAMTVGGNSTIWANRINVGASARISLLGTANIADDLALSGNRAAATIQGKYYGFGGSTSAAGQSSSIVINGHETDLNLSTSLERLMLAGCSFVGSGILDPINNSNILTGESISAKSNQLAYLIPPDCFTGSIPAAYVPYMKTNPAIFPDSLALSSDTLRACVDTTAELWDGGPSMSTYGATVQLVYLPLPASSQKLVYFYIKFDDVKKASDYFLTYFSADPDKIEGYMNLYSNSLSMDRNADNLLAGDALYYYDPDGAGGEDAVVSSISPTSASFSTVAARKAYEFNNLCETLSPNNSKPGSVYTNVVDTAAVNDLPNNSQTLFSAPDGTVVGMIIKGQVSNTEAIIDAYPQMKVIITTDNITVNQYFKGLILCDASVTLQNSLLLDKPGVSSALHAYNETLGKDMLDFLLIDSESSGNLSADSVTWDLESLVYCQNWTKH